MKKYIQKISAVCTTLAVILMIQVSDVKAQTPEPVLIQASEDAFTRAGSKGDTNFGGEDYMQAASGEGSNLHEIYLKYDLSVIADLNTIKSVKLNLIPFGTKWGTTSSTTSVSYIQDDSWSEATITYNTGRPAVTTENVAKVDLTSTATGETVETIHTIDVTSIVKGETDKILSLQVNSTLLAGDFKANYHTKEFADGGAYLEVEFKDPNVIEIQPSEDAFTRTGSKGDTNYGTADYMQAASGEGSNLHEIFLKYDLSQDISDLELVKSAKLKLIPFGDKWGEDGSTQWVSYIQDDSWSEATLTGNTRPATTQDSVAAVVTTSSGGATLETPHSINVTDMVKAETDKILSLKLSTSLLGSTFKAQYHSKEFAEGGAYLEIEFKDPSVVELQASEDAFTRAGSKGDTNFGSEDYMQAASGEGSNLHQIYLKYNLDTEDIPDLDMIKSATLNLIPFGTKWGLDGSTTSVSYIQDDSWSEGIITYNTGRPAVTTENVAKVDLTSTESGETVETIHTIDVTSIVKGETDKVLSLQVNNTLLAGTFKANYHTKEFADGGAYLEIKLSTPGIKFSASSQTIAQGGSVTFTDESTAMPNAWKWTFEGGSPAESTDQNPTVTYSTAGKYAVTLEATNIAGSSTLVKSDYIVVDADGEATLRISAVDDSFTRAGSQSDNNFGDRDFMQAASGEGSNLHQIYLKYDFSEITNLDLVISATLNLLPFGTKWGVDGSTTSVSYVQDDSWSETTITYNTGRPAVTTADVASVDLTSTESGETVELIHTIDLTDIVKGETDKVLSLEVNNTLLAGTFKANYNSKEHSSGGAYLEIVMEEEEVVSSINSTPDYGLKIFPNPSSNRITITSLDNQMERIVLYNLFGEVLKEQQINIGTKELNISLDGLSSGNYLIKAFDVAGNAQVNKVIKL